MCVCVCMVCVCVSVRVRYTLSAAMLSPHSPSTNFGLELQRTHNCTNTFEVGCAVCTQPHTPHTVRLCMSLTCCRGRPDSGHGRPDSGHVTEHSAHGHNLPTTMQMTSLRRGSSVLAMHKPTAGRHARHWTCTPEKATHLIRMSCSSSQEERCGQDPVHADTCPKGSAHSTGVPLLQQPRPTRATWQARTQEPQGDFKPAQRSRFFHHRSMRS
jgi:hypothetical protein